MAIHFFEVSASDRTFLKRKLTGEDLRFYKEPLTTIGQLSDPNNVEVLSVFVHSQVSPEIMDALPNLKMIATRSTGYDHIDFFAADSRGIPVVHVPTYGENTVAEHTFALMLALTRNVHLAYMRTTAGDFTLNGLQGIDLKGRTLGVIGTGHIGLHVIRIAGAFGMTVLAADPKPNMMASDILGFSYTTLKDLLNRSDIVSLHAPLVPATQHLIGMHNIGEFKRGAILINTARGALVDTAALLKALDEGILRGAGLDVVEGEEIFSEEKQLLLQEHVSKERLKTAIRNMSLLRRGDLILTPHLAFDSGEAVQRILTVTVGNIKALRDGALINRVTA
ncbi:MAG: NAD(P)-dependent oxidoreductase [Capsulimonadaceae bacterium]